MIKYLLKKLSRESFFVYLEKNNLNRLEKFCNSMNIVEKSSHWTKKNNLDILKFDNDKVIFKRPPVGFDRNYKFKFFNPSPIERYIFISAAIKKKISNLEDLFNRGHQYKKIEIDDSYPEFLIKNIERYKYYIL